MTDSVLAVRRLSIGWGDETLVENINFEVPHGEIFAILGGSGSGKSTLLKYLIGLRRPSVGEIDVAGSGQPDLDRGLPPFGVLFQGGALFGSLTVLENVKLPLQRWTDLGPGAIEEIARAKLRLVSLEFAADLLPAELSGGMTKRAALARALVLDPCIAFLDEPSAGLDPVTSAALDDLILTLARTTGLTVVMVTHELASLFHIVDRCLLLDRPTRSVLATGDPRELRQCADQRIRDFLNPEAERRHRSWQPVPTT